MRKTIILFLLIINYITAQKQTVLEIVASCMENDSIYIAPAYPSTINNLYDFTFFGSNNTNFNDKYKIVIVKFNKSSTILKGNFPYPQPLILSYHVPNIGSYISYPFYIDQGNYKIFVKNNKMDYEMLQNSKPNIEFKNLKGYLRNYNLNNDSLSVNNDNYIIAKQKILKKYIVKKPNSFVAFWEIVSDFEKYGFKKIYLNNLALFSNTVKKSKSYKEFKKNLLIENSIDVGGNFPEIYFENSQIITKNNFKKYNLTLIDYWSTTCKPCITDLPKLVQLFNKYKDFNINFISIADEQNPERITLALNILKNNNVIWENYVDTKKDFQKKLNASGYPLQILIDNNGKIIMKEYGEIDLIIKKIDEYIYKNKD